MLNRTLSIAPMLDWTDRHCRYFLRLISHQVLLYTEMVTTGAILQGDRNYLLNFSNQEHPLALQLGGSEPAKLAECARIAQDYGYDEINLNVGCPSDRVTVGRFGACLMAEPQLVADCVAAMAKAVSIPITVKTRIGIDEKDSYAELSHFINTVAAAGCHSFIIHARKAWLKGLSPKQNREIPPLRYDFVYQLKCDFPELEIILNGGVKELQQVQQHLNFVDGVMIGREAYQNPYMLAQADALLYGIESQPLSRYEILQQYLSYVEAQMQAQVPLKHLTRHILGLFHGVPNARLWRRCLSEKGRYSTATSAIVKSAVTEYGLEVF